MPVPNKVALLAFRTTVVRKTLYEQMAESEGVRISEWFRMLADARVAELQTLAAGPDTDPRVTA